MRFNKYLPFALIYFFVNSVALPFGLTYTALLAPFFYIWILLTRKKELLWPFIAVLLPFIFVHIFFAGVDLPSYGFSLLNLILVYVFCQAAYTFLLVCDDPGKIFRQILVINFILCLLAIVIFFTPYYALFWIEQDYTKGVREFRRLKLFTYEASYYATLFTPVFFFFFLQYIFRQNTIKGGWLLLMLLLPLLLSLSFGVIGSMFLAAIFTWLINFRRLTRKKRVLNMIISLGSISVFIISVVVLFFRHNPVLTRIANIFSGEDVSGKGRTVDAFILAGKLLEQKDKCWGMGIGQIKIGGAEIIREYYLYAPWHAVTIPNTVAETFVIFGWAGIVLRFGLEIFLFFYTKVWTNYFRLLMFFFIFIFQFAGSFITNVAEYMIWILAFTPVFRQFDVKPQEEERMAPIMTAS